MSAKYNAQKLHTNGEIGSCVIGGKMPVPHPVNCHNECPYGYGRAFCFPCMKKILGQDVQTPEKGNA